MTTQSKLLLGGLLFATLVGAAAALAGLPGPASWTAGITALCAFWWVTEALPIPATSLIPFTAFPLTGVLTNREVCAAYGHYIIMLLLGGFMVSKGIEKSGAHRRMALAMVRLLGRFGRRGLVLGFMLASALSSMWITNTATVLMLLPVVLAVLAEDKEGELAVPLLLGVAYAASIGGIATPIGTPPNLVFKASYQTHTGQDVSFPEWMSWGLPVVAVILPLAWLSLTRRIRAGAVVELPAVGNWRTAEKRVLCVFIGTALLWIFRTAPFGGWTGWFTATPIPAGDDTVALLAALVLFLIPDGEGGRLLDWPTAAKLPWGLLLLFGGGIAIAKAFEQSGLSTALGESLSTLASQSPWLVVGSLALCVTFLTEMTSNTATSLLLMPILAGAAIEANVDPKLLMVPAAMSASCAFMMPVATAPNAIVFGTGEVPIRRMAGEGLRLNLIGAAVITTMCALLFA